MAPSSAENREPIVPQGEGEAPAKGIIERGRGIHTATGYKRSVALGRHGALRGLGTSSKRLDIGPV